MSTDSRLARLERLKRSAPARPCLGCELRQITLHNEYTLAGGEKLILPPIPPSPPCTCGRKGREGIKITAVVIVRPDEVTLEEARLDHARPGLFAAG